jgi:hypothetical protein
MAGIPTLAFIRTHTRRIVLPVKRVKRRSLLLSAHVMCDNWTDMSETPSTPPETANQLAGKPRDGASWEGDLQVIELSESEMAEALAATAVDQDSLKKRQRAIDLIIRTSGVEG